ncbi:MAG: futalosine hydrolase [Bacteroidetes bacterium GWF2_43_63]|nr:MAG: futalosine hydrolase [Bacteroidetes bacterium GWE2_42_42]OFY54155.1 MAG: futalosine hydrolase [Bacteroidetes bacterium GWF2_43_63]HBG70806.1 futalosine hydrolase [Bacteroidales bacterium]HCB61710.1 futalosine hydrolase [Bacteroidales bacterium]HCY22086.1 futalosine hydrolase [Bacteroidales bacterium]
MPKKQILITAATAMELDFLLARSVQNNELSIVETKTADFTLLVSGIGSALTAFSLSKILQHKNFDAAIQIGIAGSFQEDLLVGSIVKVNSDVFADLCLSDNGKPIHEAEFSDFRTPPFTEGKLIPNSTIYKKTDLPEASAITVNSVTSTAEKRTFWLQRYNPGIETMEGAAFYYACMKENIPCVQIRAISNFVGQSNTKNWNIPLALQNLTDYTLDHLMKS